MSILSTDSLDLNGANPVSPQVAPANSLDSNPSKRARSSSQLSSPSLPSSHGDMSTSESSSSQPQEIYSSNGFQSKTITKHLSSNLINQDNTQLDTNLSTSFAGIKYKCVYGKRTVDHVNIYLRRLNNGGWVEHDEFDTYYNYDYVPMNSHHGFPDYWQPVDYPPFYSFRARYYEDHEVEGINKGNVRVKPKHFVEYNLKPF